LSNPFDDEDICEEKEVAEPFQLFYPPPRLGIAVEMHFKASKSEFTASARLGEAFYLHAYEAKQAAVHYE
jgi:hypothetical protein